MSFVIGHWSFAIGDRNLIPGNIDYLKKSPSYLRLSAYPAGRLSPISAYICGKNLTSDSHRSFFPSHLPYQYNRTRHNLLISPVGIQHICL
ncbi:MAG TPA: hypothetical protein V6D28_25150 [Leptolyngbyaceae cyanobacterium]